MLSLAVLDELVVDLRPDPDSSSLLRGGEEEGGSLDQSVLFPVLRLCQVVLASLGVDNVSDASLHHLLLQELPRVSLIPWDS